jgi:hypothetical protein
MSVVRDSFVQLREDLNKAYGLGLFPEKDKINTILEAATLLTAATPALTIEEYGFYKSASAKVTPGSDTLESLKEIVNIAAESALNLEQSAEEARRQFQTKTSKERAEYLKSGAYKGFERRVRNELHGIQFVAEKIQKLLFTPVKGAINPFNEPAIFAQHREAAKDLIGRASELANILETTLEKLTPDSLSAIAPEVKLLPSIGKCFGLGVPVALAIAGAGYYFFAS